MSKNPTLPGTRAYGEYHPPRRAPAQTGVVRFAKPQRQIAAERAVAAVLAGHGARRPRPGALAVRTAATLARQYDARLPPAVRAALSPAYRGLHPAEWGKAQLAKRDAYFRGLATAILGIPEAIAARMSADQIQEMILKGSTHE